MNFLVAAEARAQHPHSNLSTALYVNPGCWMDVAPLSGGGISTSGSHLGKRELCVERFSALFGGEPLRSEHTEGLAPGRPRVLRARAESKLQAQDGSTPGMPVMWTKCATA